jgi:hypothetical protein
MGTNAFLRGWINCNADLAKEVRRIVQQVLDECDQYGIGEDYAMQLLDCWHFPPANGPAEDFVLLGATVKEGVLPLFQAQLARIAGEVIDVDGEDRYSIAGRIEVTIEGQSDNQEWTIAHGQLDMSARRPYLLSP